MSANMNKKELKKKREKAERKYQELKKTGYISALDYLENLYESRQINSSENFRDRAYSYP